MAAKTCEEYFNSVQEYPIGKVNFNLFKGIWDAAQKNVEEKILQPTNSASTKSICDGCGNKQCTMPEKVCYKVTVSQCSGHK